MADYQAHNDEYEFVEEVPERFICNICTKILCCPHLVVCCGQHYCEACLESWFSKQNHTVTTVHALKTKSCPHCRAQGREFQHVINKGLKREVLALRVLCKNRREGCEWIGELGSLDDHLKSSSGCGYVELECPNKCCMIENWRRIKLKIKRKDVGRHLLEECVNRKYQCEYCGKTDTYMEITGLGSNFKKSNYHYLECPEQPIDCPNKCNTNKIKRKYVDSHRAQCPLEVIYCPNKCQTKQLEDRKMLRKHLNNHLDNECYLRPYKCEYCGLESTYKAIRGSGLHYQVCQEIPVPCPNNCTLRFKRKDIKFHHSHCPEEFVQCPNKCSSSALGWMKRKHLDTHIAEECPFRQYTCKHCNLRDTYTAITKHYTQCPDYPLDCSNECGARGIMRKNIASHLNECPLQLVECTFVEVGCKIEIVRQDFEKHLSTMQKQHMGLMMGAFKQMKLELDDTKSELAKTKSELDQTKKKVEYLEKSSHPECVKKSSIGRGYSRYQSHELCMHDYESD